MTVFKLKYIHEYEDRRGAVRRYFRYRGMKTPLPNEPGSEEFMRAYHECRAKIGPTIRVGNTLTPKEGSLGAVAASYYKTPDFRKLADATQAGYRQAINRLCEKHGADPVKLLERRHVIKLRNELADVPGAANSMLRGLSVVLSHAIDIGLIKINPTFGVDKFELGEFRGWTDAEVTTFRERWAPGTMQRRCMELALCTGQRRRDLVAMTKAHLTVVVDDGGNDHPAIRVKQHKTGKVLIIQMHKDLVQELTQGEQGHLSLLTTSQGKAFPPDGVYLGGWFKDAILAAGLPKDCQLHGLRSTSATRIADGGGTHSEIQAVTGHVTSSMVDRYIKGANQVKQASAAILKMENGTRTQSG
jgi:integrase